LLLKQAAITGMDTATDITTVVNTTIATTTLVKVFRTATTTVVANTILDVIMVECGFTLWHLISHTEFTYSFNSDNGCVITRKTT
jgi:hypothetical protein